jgi:hypothetical protein
MKKFIIIILSLFSLSNIYCQEENNEKVVNHYYWANIGSGISYNYDWKPVLYFSMNYSIDEILISSRYLNSSILSSNNSFSEELSLLIGYLNKSENFITSASIGIGAVKNNYVNDNISYYGNYKDEIEVWEIGLPMDLQASWIIFDKIGLGINIFANINSGTKYIGGAFCFQIGKLR